MFPIAALLLVTLRFNGAVLECCFLFCFLISLNISVLYFSEMLLMQHPDMVNFIMLDRLKEVSIDIPVYI